MLTRALACRALLVAWLSASGVAHAQGAAPGALPVPVTNNAVAAGMVGTSWWVFSALGVDSSRRWSGITTRAHAWNSADGRWSALPSVPGTVGRLAATAQVVRSRLVLFGGYAVDSTGGEKSLPAVDIFEPAEGTWRAGAPMPVPVDDAVSGVYRDSLVYVVSGWADTDNVQDVQVYDVVRNRWFAATPIPGPGVFGHSGGVSGNTIVFVDGAAKQTQGPKYGLIPQVWVGTIDEADPTRIAWTKGAPHPGPPLYRAAAGRCGAFVAVAGGTSNPYNYNGIGYDGQPSAPTDAVIAFDTRSGSWRSLPPLAAPTMDHRGLVVHGSTAWVIGGMHARQRVSDESVAAVLGTCR